MVWFQRVIQRFERLGAEFWLPLPLVGVLFWIAGDAIAQQAMSRSYSSPNQLQADTQLEMKLSVTVLIINAEIDSRQGTTSVSIKTTDSNLKKLEYEFPVTDAGQIETAIAQEIGLPVSEVRKLVRYRLTN